MADSQSLKEKRMILKSLKTRIRNNFNVAVSELDYQEKWQRTLIGVVSISNERRKMDSTLANIVKFVGRERKIEIIEYSTELF